MEWSWERKKIVNEKSKWKNRKAVDVECRKDEINKKYKEKEHK